MSDQDSFGAVATVAPTAQGEAPESSGRNSKPMFIAGGVAVVVLAVFAYLLFGTGGGSADDASGVVAKPAGTGTTAPATTDPAAADDPAAVPAKADDVEGRDPFLPLALPAPAEDTPGLGTDPSTPTDTTTDTGATPTTPTTTPTTPTAPAGETVTVKLVSVKGDVVATKVGSVNYTGLSAGDSFGNNFQVYAIFNDKCAGFLYGDQSFALCEGGATTLTKL